MNHIKGLIIKDLLQLKSYKRTLIMFILIFTVTSIVQENSSGIGSMIVVMMTLGLGMFSMATFNYDEMAKADRYILTLPLTKKEIVLSKYILVSISTIIGSIIGILLSLVIGFIMNKQFPNILDIIYLGLGGILGVGFVEAIQIPCVYKFGAEKGRIQIFIVIALIAFLIGGIFFIGEKVNINWQINNVLNLINSFLPIILILSTVVIYYISYKIAYKIYKKKEI